MHKEHKDLRKGSARSRRSILKGFGAGVAGLSLANMVGAPIEEQVAFATQNIRRSSSPSQLRITDLRIAVVSRAPMRCPLIRIDTNQDICGYGEVRDGASERYALMLKSRLLGRNPCNVEQMFKRIRQFGYHGRQGGGVSGVEMALWDLAGKAYGVPVYQMLGGRYRDRIRLYADTPDGKVSGLKKRISQGFTFLKYDCGIQNIRDVRGRLAIRPRTPTGMGSTRLQAFNYQTKERLCWPSVSRRLVKLWAGRFQSPQIISVTSA